MKTKSINVSNFSLFSALMGRFSVYALKAGIKGA